MNKNKLIGNIMLFVTALIWGSAFVAQNTAMDSIGPFTFNALRNILGGTVLLPVILIFGKVNKKTSTKLNKKTLYVGILCGVLLCVASLLQQFGIAIGKDPGKAGFITALYILMVPIIGLFLRKKVAINQWISVGISLVGLYFLCNLRNSSLQLSDILLIACALIFAFHIVAVDNLAIGLNGIIVSSIQFYTSAILSSIGMFIFEKPSISNIISAMPSIAYAGILSSGVAYTLQILGQQRTEPTVASMIMSLESAFAVLTNIAFTAFLGAIVLPSFEEWIGMALMFTAIILAQLTFSKKKRVS